MSEILPLGAGLVLALILARWRPSSRRQHWVITAACSALAGLAAAAIAGELAESWLFALFGAIQVAVTMALVSWLLQRWSDHTTIGAEG